MQEVAVAVIIERGRVLLGQRRQGNRYGGVWEFPGGKVERGESPLHAVLREVHEELGIEAPTASLLTSVEHRYDDGGTFRLWFFLIDQWQGTPRLTLWQQAEWVPLEHLDHYPMFEANRRVLPELIRLLRESEDERYMRIALDIAAQAARRREVPVGCVIVRDGAIIGAGSNRTEEWRDATAHAELCALRQAMERLRTKWLDGCTLYVTLEPCPMCAGAIVLARIARVVFGAHDPKAGACETLYTLTSDRRLNHRATVRGGVLAEEAQALLQDFFHAHRQKNR